MPRAFPVRAGNKSERNEEGPRPFSQEWLRLPPEQRQPPPRRSPLLPDWVPSERVLSGIMVILLVFLSVLMGSGATPKTTANNQSPSVTPSAIAAATDDSVIVAPTTPTSAPTESAIGTGGEATADQTPEITPTPTLPADDPRALLPRYRIVSYYGQPADENMGILGEFDKEDLLVQLRDEAKAYEDADPTRKVIPAFEVVASVAQNWPADDNTYLLHTDDETIQSYVDFARENDIIIILDLQIGHSTIEAEIERVRPWLEEPFVHLALDPEFALSPGEVPGDVIGSLDASDIANAQQILAEIVAEHDLPPKILIVHRFTENMITNADQIPVMAGVQVVVDFDGFGDPASKIEGYDLFLDNDFTQFAAIKLFYQHDSPLLQPQEVVALRRIPDIVIYQ